MGLPTRNGGLGLPRNGDETADAPEENSLTYTPGQSGNANRRNPA
ncbi:hypothetical protein SXCC_00747 [Gluconacetobacter sp. SXCC-1]|nr:hypothetical protein SXCC_00747 [Gluconacetobacter sp. SXCC-1]